jgi:membrane-associated phospholipid phosphatase
MLNHLNYELGIIQYLHSIRPEFLDPFFILCNKLDTGPYYILIASIVLALGSPKWGARCMLLVAITIILNFLFKHMALQPRPFILDPSLALVPLDSKYGLPSGAAQAATVIAMLLCYWIKSNWMKVLAIGYVLLVCTSRIYIGVHFFTDVIVGVLIGFTVGKLYLNYYITLETLLAKIPAVIIAFLAIPLMTFTHIFTVNIKANIVYLIGAGMIGALLTIFATAKSLPKLKFNAPKSCSHKIINLSIALSCFYLINTKAQIYLPALSRIDLASIYLLVVFGMLAITGMAFKNSK